MQALWSLEGADAGRVPGKDTVSRFSSSTLAQPRDTDCSPHQSLAGGEGGGWAVAEVEVKQKFWKRENC